MREIVIGVDTGGTFTDVVRVDRAGPGAPPALVRTRKVPSTPEDPAAALLEGIAAVLDDPGPGDRVRVVHGTTVATNALLERRLARAALVTNAGMEDLVEVGRQARPDLYALHPVRPAPLVPRERRFGLPQRTAADGAELARESEADLAALEGALRDAGAEAVAVCLLHSALAPGAERRVAARLRERLAVAVVSSADLCAEPREVERFETALASAALTPGVSRYLERVAARAPGPVLVMRSDGGMMPAAAIAREPVRTLLSGPAGGVLGAARAARAAGLGPFISIDVGGTSSDVALSDAAVRPAGVVGGVPVAVPSLDIVSVALGGGSIAWVDAGGALRVGPRSAGARPGPACTGRGEEPTLTDAALVLGRLDARFFLGGALRVEPERSRAALARLAARAGLTLERAAAGVLEVSLALAERALLAVPVERGEDPRRRDLVAFGGAGGLLAADLAARLGMRRALVPANPGLLSALGMAAAPRLLDRAAVVLARLEEGGGDGRGEEFFERVFRDLEEEVLAGFAREGAAAGEVRLEREADLRYEGQSHEVRIAWRRGRTREDFHAAHERRNGFRDEGRGVEVVAVRVVGRVGGEGEGEGGGGGRSGVQVQVQVQVEGKGEGGEGEVQRKAQVQGDSRGEGSRGRSGGAAAPVGRSAAGALYRREDLAEGTSVTGPAAVGEYSGTTWVPEGWRATALGAGMLLERAGA